MYIELGYNEVPAYIEVNIFPKNIQTVNITPFISKFGLSNRYTSPFDFYIEGVNCMSDCIGSHRELENYCLLELTVVEGGFFPRYSQ